MPSQRKTSQWLAPVKREPTAAGQYDIYPGFPISSEKISLTYADLANALKGHEQVIVDGYEGVLWDDFRRQLNRALTQLGIRTYWIDASAALLPPDEIDQLIAPFLGGEDPIFGTRFTGELADFFDPAKLIQFSPNPDANLSIIYGCGASLCEWEGLLIYVDLPKNEIQFRARAGRICNLGAATPYAPKAMYKRFYFVDWIALNIHKAKLLPKIDLIVDGQRPDAPLFANGHTLRSALSQMSQNYFRVRPWFEPGP